MSRIIKCNMFHQNIRGLRSESGELIHTFEIDNVTPHTGNELHMVEQELLHLLGSSLCRKGLQKGVVDYLCGLVVRVLGYRSVGPGSIPGTIRKKSSGSGTGSTQPREYN
jgi:hypothetical protein